MAFRIVTELCNHHRNFRIFSSPLEETRTPQPRFRPQRPVRPVATTNALPVSMNSPVLNSSYKGNRAICGPLRLASLTQHIVFTRNLCPCRLTLQSTLSRMLYASKAHDPTQEINVL